MALKLGTFYNLEMIKKTPTALHYARKMRNRLKHADINTVYKSVAWVWSLAGCRGGGDAVSSQGSAEAG